MFRSAIGTRGAFGMPRMLSSPAGSIQYPDGGGKGGSSLGLMNAARDPDRDRELERERRRWRCFECSLPMMSTGMDHGRAKWWFCCTEDRKRSRKTKLLALVVGHLGPHLTLPTPATE